MKQINIEHVEAVAQLNYRLAAIAVGDENVIKLGNQLIPLLDPQSNGFWIWDLSKNIEFYSPEFRRVLGFESEEDFPNTPESWQNIIFPEDKEKALKAFNRHLADPEEKYYLTVRYHTKNGGTVELICAGTIVNRDNPDRLIMIGTHELVV